MTNILTRAHIPGSAGFQNWGRLTRAEIIKQTRDFARHCKAEAEAILDAPDDAFDVAVVRGVHVQKIIKKLPPEAAA